MVGVPRHYECRRLTGRELRYGLTGARLDYTYTARDQVETVTRTNTGSFVDPGAETVGKSTYAYDDGGRLTGLTHADGAGATLAAYAYAYDKADRLTQKTENGVATAYAYDAAGQLTQDGAKAYSYW